LPRQVIAGTTQAQTVAVIPPQVVDARAAAEALAPVLEMDSEKIYELINLEKRRLHQAQS
jgi:hypothetical protein